MDYRVILFLTIEALFALFLLYRSGNLRTPAGWVASVLLLAAAFVSRGLVFDYETLDYQNFLAPWVDFYRTHGGVRALDTAVGNYNIPYLYFLALFSYSSIRELYWIKLFSVFFDVLLSWGAMRLTARLTDHPARRLASFFTVLLLPTVFLNGALWGQCDSVYTALAVLALALALEDKPARSMICLALSFGFKLQAVFVMPVFAVLLFAGKIRWRHLPVFPLTYVLLVLPAVLAGRPFMDTLTLYLGQTGSIGSGLNYNSPSVFALLTHVEDPVLASRLAIGAAFAFMLGILAVCFFCRRRLNDGAILAAAALLAIGIPFLLPHMHDRYFFAADVLTTALAFAAPLCAPAALLTQFASLLGYHAYLKMRYLLLMDHGARALIGALVFAALYFVSALKREGREKLKLDKPV